MKKTATIGKKKTAISGKAKENIKVSRVNCYTKKEFEALANAVNSGLPVNEAEQIIQRERKLGATGVEYFWARIKIGNDSSVRLKYQTINKLKELKESGYERTFELIIKKLVRESKEANQIIKEVEKIENARKRINSGKFVTEAEARKKLGLE